MHSEIATDLEPTELVSLQGVCRRFLRLARDGPLWRFRCYYDSPKTTINRIGQKSWSQALAQSLVGDQQTPNGHTYMSNKARATDEWDLSDPSEKVDWYSEYISRHAQLSASWLNPQSSPYRDIRGAALMVDDDHKALIGPLENGSLSVWNVSRKEGGPSRHQQIRQEFVTSSPGILFGGLTASSESSKSNNKKALAFSGVADCISVDSARKRAYVAVGDLLSEVDLNTLEVIRQTEYAWTITALSDILSPYQPLTVGTSFSLHILDHRSPSRHGSCSQAGKVDLGDSIAFFPNKDSENKVQPAKRIQIYPLCDFGSNGLNPQSHHHATLPTFPVSGRRDLSSYAKVEPAPLSILHQTDNSIMVAGRFPSILNYDRRYFPRLEYVIHSSARLSALAYLPFSPRGIKQSSVLERRGTLISCGEYNGRGSLELYSVPHSTSSSVLDPDTNNAPTASEASERDINAAPDPFSNNSNATQTPPDIPCYQNRQSISSAKLLSVATQGTRIVFSDADGGLKWVERDGRTVARRWNINSYQLHQESFPRLGRTAAGAGIDSVGHTGTLEAAIHGEEVVRKIIPTGKGEADDLLVWTGERIGLVGFGRDEEFHDALDNREWTGKAMAGDGRDDVVKSFESFIGPRMEGDGTTREQTLGPGDLEEQAQEYDRQMRRALERQADELNWMHRFGFRSSP